MDSLIWPLAVGLGFGLACLIFAALLSGSNDIGNSVSRYKDYSGGVSFVFFRDDIRKSAVPDYDEVQNFGNSFITEADRNRSEPASDLLVEQPLPGSDSSV